MGSAMRPLLMLRTDGGPRPGWGHVLRCLALAQGWEAVGGSCLFLLSDRHPEPAGRLQQAGQQVLLVAGEPGSEDEAKAVVGLVRRWQPAWLVVDGYHFSGDYYRAVREAGAKLLVLDDSGGGDYDACDLVLNQNLGATAALYSRRAATTRLLLGPHYVLLRREFWPWRQWQRQQPVRATHLLLTLGGGDQRAVWPQLLAIGRQLPKLTVTVAVGQAGVAETYRSQLAALGWRVVSAGTEMPALMAAADLALAGAGTTCWELAFMELPSLLIVLAENQRQNAELLGARGAAVNLGRAEDLQPEVLAAAIRDLQDDEARRRELIQRGGRRLVDGAGVVRVVRCLLEQEL